jgi:hypothetical protein
MVGRLEVEPRTKVSTSRPSARTRGVLRRSAAAFACQGTRQRFTPPNKQAAQRRPTPERETTLSRYCQPKLYQPPWSPVRISGDSGSTFPSWETPASARCERRDSSESVSICSLPEVLSDSPTPCGPDGDRSVSETPSRSACETTRGPATEPVPPRSATSSS